MNATEQNGKLVISIERSLRDGEHGLKALPRLIKAAIKENAWHEYYSDTLRQVVQHETFESFITEEPPDGLGSTIEQIKDLCRSDTQTLDLIDKATQHEPYIHHDSNNVTITGNTATYALRKLRKDAPTLHEKVINNELSPHAAMVQAGFRKKTVTIPIEVDAIIRAIRRSFTEDEIQIIVNELGRTA